MSTDIEVGQVWVRKGGTGFNEDQITIMEDVAGPDDEESVWLARYGDGVDGQMSDAYIQKWFEYQTEHPEEWSIEDNDGDTLWVNPGFKHDENLVFRTTYGQMVVLRPDDINDLIHWLQTHQAIRGNNR